MIRWIAILAALGAAAFLLLRDRPRAPLSSTPLRSAPAVPSPTPEEKIAYFYGVLKGGATFTLRPALPGAAPIDIPVWSDIGVGALRAFGEPAFEFLMSPARQPDYLGAPNVLLTVLDLLVRAPPLPQLFPFLEGWLDEKNCPPAVPGSDWPEEVRLHVFAALRTHPVPAAAQVCEAELLRKYRSHDLRGAAISILLELRKADILNDVFRELPPTPEIPEPDMRAELLERLFQMAAPNADAGSRAQVERLEPLLNEARERGRTIERVGATATLFRLGKPSMDEALRRFYEEREGSDDPLAWSALKLLVTDRADPYVKEACLDRIRKPDMGVGFATAVRLLAQWWPAEIAPKYLEWVRLGLLDPYMAMPAMLTEDRDTTLRWLRSELRTDDLDALIRALTFIAGERITELVPELIELVRRLDPAHRPAVYRTLVLLRAPGVEALLLAELAAGLPDALRAAAAAEMLNLGGAEGEERLAELLAAGDAAVLDTLLGRTRTLGGFGVPTRLVPALLQALRGMPSEDGRRTALLVLRLRGRFDDVRDGLIEAYRFEPSRRVAQEIGAAIEELAHR